MQAQSTFPYTEGERSQYSAYIEMSRGYLSGVLVLLREEGAVKGCLFNEFGLTALDFTFYPERQKVKLNHVIEFMDHWYIRRIIRKDISQIMICLQKGETTYINKHRNITYQFTPIENEVPE